MAEPSLVIQGWVYSTLSALSALTSLSCEVYDRPPASAVPPYVTIGAGQTRPTTEEDGCEDGFEVFVTIQAFSTKPGFPEVKQIADAVYGALHEAAPSLSGFVCDFVFCESISYQREDDGLTSRAILTLRMGVHASS